MKYRNKYRRLKNATHFNEVRVYSKQYKKTVNKAFREYKKATINKLRTLQSENPKEYWNIIQGKTKQVNETKISLDIFEQHFKKLASETNQTEACHREELNVADDPDLNKPFTTQEITKAIKKLKSHKSSGIDQIINEFFKHSPDKLIPVYAKLFNIILSTGIVPDDWAISIIRPIYKNKGDNTDPNNYRGISLLSCFGKLFTSCLNERLSNFVKAHDTVGPEQAGFKSDNSTIDHIFVLKTLADIYLNKRKRLYCCFVDYQKAFDTINRTKLWSKLLSSGISGRILKVIKNLYSQAKSCVNVNGKNSEYFSCNVGVRQGENLSPLLFSLYLADLNEFISRSCKGLEKIQEMDQLVHDPTEDLVSYLKLYILMYADDTVLLAESPEDLQKYLDTLNEYCNNFDLKINTSKTKIFIFSRGKLKNIPSFNFADMKLDVVNDYNYLGVTFNFNAKFNVAKQSLYQKGCRAMFALLKRIKSLSLPPDIALKLFDTLVKPVVLYGAEVWGSENCDIVNKVKLRFCKYILHAHKSTCSNMVYGELGETPLHIDIKCKMILYWARLINSKENKLSKLIYSLIYKLYEKDLFHSSWITSVKNILDSAGFSGIWTNQSLPKSPHHFNTILKLRLHDQFIQNWNEGITKGGKCTVYRIIKNTFGFEKYLTELPVNNRILMTKFRCRNHRLPIEAGCRAQIQRDLRLCLHCNDIGDEYHYLLCCPLFREERKKYINVKFWKRPSTIQLEQLFKQNDYNNVLQLSLFVKVIIAKF